MTEVSWREENGLLFKPPWKIVSSVKNIPFCVTAQVSFRSNGVGKRRLTVVSTPQFILGLSLINYCIIFRTHEPQTYAGHPVFLMPVPPVPPEAHSPRLALCSAHSAAPRGQAQTDKAPRSPAAASGVIRSGGQMGTSFNQQGHL